MSLEHRIAGLTPSWKIHQSMEIIRGQLGQANRVKDPAYRKIYRRAIMRTLNELRSDLKKAEEFEGQRYG